MDLVCLGELLVDMFPAELGRRLVEVSAFYPKPGGAPANVAVAAARLGARSAFVGRVGEDAFGRHLAEVLRREGVEVRGMQFDLQARTTMAFIAQPDEDHAEFVFYRNPGADMLLSAEELDLTLIRQARAFHFGSLSLIQEPSRTATLSALTAAREAGALISFDVNYRPSLWGSLAEAQARIQAAIPHAHLLKVNEIELELLAGTRNLEAGSAALLRQGPGLIVVTLGRNGSFFMLPAGSDQVPGFEVATVDATGCGDAFVAGLLTRLVRAGDWRVQLEPETLTEVLRYANAVGALTALTRGVIPALPTGGQVQAFLDQTSARSPLRSDRGPS